MANINPRINVTFEATTAKLLARLANKQHKSVASIVHELALEALELHEDIYFSNLAKKLDQPGVKTYAHDAAWK
jgi:hypothetical protein